MEFLEEANPNNPNKLLPSDPFARARLRIWTDYISKTLVPAFYKLLQAKEPSDRPEAKTKLIEALKTWTAEIEGDPWFLPGEGMSIVDVALAPWCVRMFLITKHRDFHIEDVGPKFVKWFEAVMARESVKNTSSDQDMVEKVYQRYLDNTAQSGVAVATRDNKPLP